VGNHLGKKALKRVSFQGFLGEKCDFEKKQFFFQNERLKKKFIFALAECSPF
jgi:hypothetical protein